MFFSRVAARAGMGSNAVCCVLPLHRGGSSYGNQNLTGNYGVGSRVVRVESFGFDFFSGALAFEPAERARGPESLIFKEGMGSGALGGGAGRIGEGTNWLKILSAASVGRVSQGCRLSRTSANAPPPTHHRQRTTARTHHRQRTTASAL